MNAIRRRGAQSGFTLIEILVSTLLGSFFLAGLMSMATHQVSSARDQSTQIDLQQAVRNVAELFGREVRRAGANPTCSADVKAIQFASHWMLRLHSDLDANGSIQSQTEVIIYQHDPVTGTFRRIAGGEIETLLDNVVWGQVVISYFDANGVELPAEFYGLDSANRDKVRRVRFAIDIEQRTPNGEIVRAQSSTDVTLRNRFFIQSAGC